MKNFIIIGVGGYIAKRHLQAIKDTNNNLIAALDIHDSVGIMDSFFPDCEFFQNFEEFAAYIDMVKLKGVSIDYVSICSPNYLHKAHIIWSLKQGIDVICEKPLVLKSIDLDDLCHYEKIYKKQVNSILQLRLHPSIIKLKEMVDASKDKIFDVDLTYLTSRGKWYLKSWKGDSEKSGGVAANIGVHFFDMLHYIFGNISQSELHYRDSTTVSGYLEYEKARVKWFLSIDAKYLPENSIQGEKLTFRSIKIEDEELEFSEGFTDMHTMSYKKIIASKGFNINENRSAIQTVEQINKISIVDDSINKHSLMNKIKN